MKIIAGGAFEAKKSGILITEGGNVWEYIDNTIAPATTADDTWKQGVIDVDTFSKYAYFLDPIEQQVWKYERGSVGFSKASGWVKSGNAELANAHSIAIDGSIFVGTNDGRILKYHQGNLQTYEVVDFPFSEMRIDRIYTSPDIDYLYAVDQANSSVTRFYKGENQLVYQDQKIVEGVGTISDIIALGQRLWAVTEDSIIEI